MDTKFNEFFSVNKETWNKKVPFHYNSKFYNVNNFKKGETSLNKYEIDEVGDVFGKSLLHLQCHFGLDTLSWSRLGAKCVGVDFSNEATKKATILNNELGLNAKFVTSNVYDIINTVPEKFDIVFTSYGVIGWLPNLTEWANIIADKLQVGGIFYVIEFHPIAWMFDYRENPPKMVYPYLNNNFIYEEYSGTYADLNAVMVSKEYGWNHGLGEVISALVAAGLQIEFLHEFEESPYNSFPNMVKSKNGLFTFKQKLFPLLFSLKAVKK